MTVIFINKQTIKKCAAIVSLIIILVLTGLSVYFGVTGNNEAFFLVISSNAFFVVMLYFLIRLSRSSQIKSRLSEMEDPSTGFHLHQCYGGQAGQAEDGSQQVRENRIEK